MRRLVALFVLCFLFVGEITAQAPPALPPIVLPVSPTPGPGPLPPPVPPNGPITNIAVGQLYCITSTADFGVDTCTVGIVKIIKLKTPTRVIGDFVNPLPTDDPVDGSRMFPAGTFVCVIRGVSPGAVKLLINQDFTGLHRTVVDLTVGNPPTPVPPNPPADPFVLALQGAYSQEAGPTKVDDTAQLAGVFRVFAKSVLTNKTYVTVQDVNKAVRATTDALIQPTGLPKVRHAVGVELTRLFPTSPDAVLDAPTRELFSAQYTRMALALEGLK